MTVKTYPTSTNMRLPDKGEWTQFNKGDKLGFLHETENVTLTTDGKLKLSRKSFNRYNSTDDADLVDVIGIVFYGWQYFAVTTGNAFLFGLGGSGVTQVALTSDTGLNSDVLVCYDRAYITTNDNLDYYDGALTASNYALTASYPHPLALFDSQTTYKLAVGNKNTVLLLNSSHSLGATLTLPTQFIVNTLSYRNGYLYVGTKHVNGGEARIFIWDGSGTSANYDVPVGASQVYSLIPYLSTVAFITNMGRLCLVSGTSYTELASLPVYDMPNVVWDNTEYLSSQPKVMNRGMVAVNDNIYIHIDGTVDSGYVPEMKHGLWVYDPQKGLYHRSHSNVDCSVVETPSALSSNTLTLSTHGLKDGDLVIIRSVGSLTGVTTGKRYYAKVISATQIKLARSRKALKNEQYVDIGGAVTSSNVSYVPNTDHGQFNNTFAGAVTLINPEEPFFLGWETPVIWGNRITDTDGNNFYAIYSFTEAWNIGRLTTQRIYSGAIRDTFQSIYGFFTGLELDNEEIVVKYKTDADKPHLEDVFTGTWLDENRINVPISESYEVRDIEVGNELTILDGYGRGYTTHVTAIENSSTIYTFTVDESIGTANQPVRFSVDSFRKVATITNTNKDRGTFKSDLKTDGNYIILKLELRGFEIEDRKSVV